MIICFHKRFQRDARASLVIVLFSMILIGSTIGIQNVGASSFASDSENISKDEVSDSVYVLNAGLPPSGEWYLLGTDPDEGNGTSLRYLFWQSSNDTLYFKVVHWRAWITINDVDTGIFLDVDQDPATGCPDGFYPGQNNDMGAEFLILVGFEGTEVWWWNDTMWDVTNPIPLAYLDAPNGTDTFIVGVYLADLGLSHKPCIDVSVAEPMSEWDWLPDSGHFTICLRRAVGGVIVPVNNFDYIPRSVGLIGLIFIVPIVSILRKRTHTDN